MAQSFSNLHPVNEILSQFASEASSQLDAQLIHQDLFETVQVPKSMRSGTILIENNNQYMGTSLDLKRNAGASRVRQSSFDFEFQYVSYGFCPGSGNSEPRTWLCSRTTWALPQNDLGLP